MKSKNSAEKYWMTSLPDWSDEWWDKPDKPDKKNRLSLIRFLKKIKKFAAEFTK